MTRTVALVAALVLAAPSGASSEPEARQSATALSQLLDSSGPITITAGGTYSGNWTSTSSTPAVRIATSEPVSIVNSTVTNLAGGVLVESPHFVQGNVTIDHVTAYGGEGRLFEAENFKAVTIRNSTIYKTRGIELTGGVPGSSVLITRNKHRNIQGYGVSPVGNFVQLRVLRSTTIDISWNEIVNEHDKSYPEDIISLYHTSNARVHDNMLWHQSAPGNPYNQSSQGGITLDSSTPGPGCHNNVIARNQVVDGMGIVAYVTEGGNNNLLLENRIINDGRLPNGVRNGNGWLAMRVLPGGSNNHAHGNVIGFINRTGTRRDGQWDGTPEGDAGEWLNNRHMPGPITRATEKGEWTLWKRKLAASRIRVGA